jgi:hypothetical protein
VLLSRQSSVIDLLLRMYDESKTEGEKRETLHPLHQAMQLPGNANYGDAITVMVLDNTLRIAQFFADRAETEQFEILQTVEHHYLWLYRRTKGLADRWQLSAFRLELLQGSFGSRCDKGTRRRTL